MKKMIVAALLLSGYYAGKAQMIVVAPDVTTAIAAQGIEHKMSMLTQLTEAIKQTVELSESTGALKKSVDVFYKVSGTLKNVQSVKKTLDKQIDLVTDCGKILRDASRFRQANNVSFLQLEKNVNGIIAINKDYIELVKTILEDGGFKMNDAERLKLLSDIDTKIDDHKKHLQEYYAAFEVVNMMRNFVIKNF